MTKKFSFFGILIIIFFAVFALSQRNPAVEAEKLITPIPQADPNQVTLDHLKHSATAPTTQNNKTAWMERSTRWNIS